MSNQWDEITRDDVLKAIEVFNTDRPKYAKSKNTFLIYKDQELPAKKIRGMAYQEHYGKDISFDSFSGGKQTVDFFTKLSFTMIYKDEVIEPSEIVMMTMEYEKKNKAITSHNVPKANEDSHDEKDDLITFHSHKEKIIHEDQKEPTKVLRPLKVVMYLQTSSLRNKKEFKKMIKIMREGDADLLVFPEICYVPEFIKLFGRDLTTQMFGKDIYKDEGKKWFHDVCLDFAKAIDKPVIVNTLDRYDTIFSMYVNPHPAVDETESAIYVKHTMCNFSPLELDHYRENVSKYFPVIKYQGYRIGMTICYDCNHALFSRIYGLQGVDLIVNGTGGNVVKSKWFKYNKARAIENHCYNLVTMGGDDDTKSNNYVFGFNKNGGSLKPVELGHGLYEFEVKTEAGKGEIDTSNKEETLNRNWQFEFPATHVHDYLSKMEKITDAIFHQKIDGFEVFFLLVSGEDILKPEVVQKLLYAPKLKDYKKKKYVIVNAFDDPIDEQFFLEKLSTVLKVRSMENFCAVVLISPNICKCYQAGNNRSAQVVKKDGDCWKIDLKRTTGPEAIWRDKEGMRASWRKNYEWLVEHCEQFASTTPTATSITTSKTMNN